MQKGPGRPQKAPNNSSVFTREFYIKIRSSEGLCKTVEALIATGNYKSQADVIHEAVQFLALKKLSKKADINWVNKIQ